SRIPGELRGVQRKAESAWPSHLEGSVRVVDRQGLVEHVAEQAGGGVSGEAGRRQKRAGDGSATETNLGDGLRCRQQRPTGQQRNDNTDPPARSLTGVDIQKRVTQAGSQAGRGEGHLVRIEAKAEAEGIFIAVSLESNRQAI